MKSLHISIYSIAAFAASFYSIVFLAFAGPELIQARQIFVEGTNGLFSVSQFDPDRQIIERWKGVFVRKEELPSLSRFSLNTLIFARGERPAFPSNASENDYWKPSSEQLYYYGDIPYPIEEIDPALVSYQDTNGDILIGFHLRSRFYAVMNLGRNATMEGISIQNANPDLGQPQSGLEVVTVGVPSHRWTEIQTVSNAFKKAK